MNFCSSLRSEENEEFARTWVFFWSGGEKEIRHVYKSVNKPSINLCDLKINFVVWPKLAKMKIPSSSSFLSSIYPTIIFYFHLQHDSSLAKAFSFPLKAWQAILVILLQAAGSGFWGKHRMVFLAMSLCKINWQDKVFRISGEFAREESEGMVYFYRGSWKHLLKDAFHVADLSTIDHWKFLLGNAHKIYP